MSKRSALSTEGESRDDEVVRGPAAASFQIADRRQEQRRERQDDRDRTGDHKDERWALALRQKCGADGSDRCQQCSAEVIDARDAPEEPPRYVDLECRDPEHPEAREAESLNRAGDK